MYIMNPDSSVAKFLNDPEVYFVVRLFKCFSSQRLPERLSVSATFLLQWAPQAPSLE